MKYNLGQEIWYMMDNKAHSAMVLSRSMVENKGGELPVHKQFGEAGIRYATVHGIISESGAFASKQELLNSL